MRVQDGDEHPDPRETVCERLAIYASSELADQKVYLCRLLADFDRSVLSPCQTSREQIVTDEASEATHASDSSNETSQSKGGGGLRHSFPQLPGRVAAHGSLDAAQQDLNIRDSTNHSAARQRYTEQLRWMAVIMIDDMRLHNSARGATAMTASQRADCTHAL